MNGKRAKILRKLAGVSKGIEQTYSEDSSTVKKVSVKNLAGDIVFVYRTVTLKLAAGPRTMYKLLKKLSRQSR